MEDNKKFFYEQKDTYTKDELNTILEQNKKFLLNDFNKDLNSKLEQEKQEKLNLEKQLKDFQIKNTLNNIKPEYKDLASELIEKNVDLSKYEDLMFTKQITPSDFIQESIQPKESLIDNLKQRFIKGEELKESELEILFNKRN